MKKFKFAALMMCFVAMGLMFASCSKSNEDLIIGKWKCVKMVDEGVTYTTPGEDVVGSIWEFAADGKMTMSMGGYSINGTYTLNDDVLTFTVMGSAQTSNIDKLTKSKMILSDPENSKNTVEFDKQ